MDLDEAEQAYTEAAEAKRIADGDVAMAEARLATARVRAQAAWQAEYAAGNHLLSMLRGEVSSDG